MEQILDKPDLMTIDEAARDLGIEPKRLRGFIFRNGIADPIGDCAHVYGWSLATLRERLRATVDSAVAPE